VADTSILTSIKATLGLLDDYTPFDAEITLHINSVVSNLRQLGVGPEEGLTVDADTLWTALLVTDEQRLISNVKSYMFLRVKMLFDSAGMPAHLISAYEKMIEEQEWRITVAADPMLPWETPTIISPILDGGEP
jgi:hypothetical protein